jgi:hypothetical protein
VSLIGFSGNDEIALKGNFYPLTRRTEMALFRKHERTGRPTGDDAFIERLERVLDRPLKPKKPPKLID